MSVFKVMLAATPDSDSDLRFPLIASPKIDGFRGYVASDGLHARSGKRVANRATAAFFGHQSLLNLDGELIVGSPTSKKAFQTTTSALRTEDGDPKAVLLVFDYINLSMPFDERLKHAAGIIALLPPQYKGRVVPVTQMLVHSLAELLEFEVKCLALGFEGVIVRSPKGRYKQGRSTVAEQGMLKLKRFSDSEAVIIGRKEEVEGSTKRLKGSLGAFVVRDIKSGVEFSVGSGFTPEQRQEFWHRDMTGEILKYKYFTVGMVTAPRHPTFCGLRAAVDM